MALITQDIPLSQALGEDPSNPRVVTPWSELVDRKDVARRETQSLPLRRICWELYATTREAVTGDRWIPPRFTNRQERLALYQQAFDGDLSGLIPDRSYTRVALNEFRQACLFKADLLTSSDIMQTPEIIHPAVLTNAVSACVTSQEQNGIGLLNAGMDEEGEPFIRTIDPLCWFPRMDGGHIVAVPYVSDEATTDIPDRIRMDIIEPDGRAMRWEFEYTSHYSKGRQLSRMSLPGLQYVVPVYRSPQVPGWGTSLFDDIAPIALEHMIRMTSYSKILNAHENPILNIFMGEDDVADFGGSTPLEEAEFEAGDQEAARIRAKYAAQDYRNQDVGIGFDTEAKLDYMTWDGALEASNRMLDRLEEAIAKVSGVPKILRDGEGFSGVALRRLFIPLYASTLAMLNDTRYALETILTMVNGGDVTIEWEHPFDYEDLEMTQDEEPDQADEEMDEEEGGDSGVEG